MKIDSELIFKRVVVGSQVIDGEFRIIKGSGPLSNELFVLGTARAQYPDGTEVSASVVWPYSKVDKLIIEMPKIDNEEQE